MNKNKFLLLLLLFFVTQTIAQQAYMHEPIFNTNIKNVKFFQQNNQQSLPIINLGSNELLELHFDDLQGGYKSYYYTFQLCNADWSVANVSAFDYIKGFTQNRINQYRPSSITQWRYAHYQALLPEHNCTPIKSGNYLLKVFLNNDTSQLVFTKRMYVVQNKAAIGLQVTVPFNFQFSKTHQKVNVILNTKQLDIFNALQQVKLNIMQNNRLDNAKLNIKPSFIKEETIEYNTEPDMLFEAGKEYRWIDLRSFRYMADRVMKKDTINKLTHVYLMPETDRVNDRIVAYRDINGWYETSTTDLVNNWWQTDYANVVFTFTPKDNTAYANQDVYVIGEFTGNNTTTLAKMDFNTERGVYEKKLLLKQGFYSYTYATKPNKDNSLEASTALTEGNYWETDNEYTVFVYNRSFSSRHDELVGIATTHSKLGQNSLRF